MTRLEMMPHSIPKLALTYEEAIEATGVSREVLKEAVRKNELIASYPSSRPVFRISELERWLESLPTERP